MDPIQPRPKEIISGIKVRAAVLKGITAVYEPVASTLGSKGRNVLIEHNWGPPTVIHDGVTVARSIVLSDPFANAAAQSVIDAAKKTNDEAGDGTTTATILTYAITKEALEIVAAGSNPAPIRKGINKAVTAVVDELKRFSQPVKELQEMIQVATISSADAEMGSQIANAIRKVGEHGIVSVQVSNIHPGIKVDYKEGMEFEKGYISPYLINNGDREEAVYERDTKKEHDDSPYVLIVNDKLDNDKFLDLIKALLGFDQAARLLIIADDYSPETMETIVLTKLRSNKGWVAVKSPDFGEHRTMQLTDIATVTGGKVIGGAAGVPYEGTPDQILSYFGRADRILVSKNQTLIIGGKGDKKEIKSRITALQNELKNSKTDGSRDKVEKRLAKLVGGVAVITVGANSDQEIQELKERVIDAVNSTKNAVDEGIVPGGGVALIRASKVIDKLEMPDSEKVGANIVKRALYYPLRKLVENAGSEDPGFVSGKILESDDENLGYNVDSEAFENMFDSGIIDPVKVGRCAIQNAASTAIMLMTSNFIIAYEREESKKPGNDTEGISDFRG